MEFGATRKDTVLLAIAGPDYRSNERTHEQVQQQGTDTKHGSLQ
jgi:hypothetical protein